MKHLVKVITSQNSSMFIKKRIWESLKSEDDSFLGNNTADNYKELIETILKSFKMLG